MSIQNVKPFWHRHSALAFDVSTRSTGWAMWTDCRIISGVIQPPKKLELLWERIRYIHREVKDLLYDNADVDYGVFMEETIPKGFHMVAVLSEARASVITAIPSILTFENVSPSTWKSYFKCVTGNSDRDKETAHKMMCQLWHKDFPVTMLGKEKSYDETDAVAVLTYGIYNKSYEEAQ